MTDDQVRKILEEYRTPPHVRRHCEAVARLAIELGEKLALRGHPVDTAAVTHGALLHDFVRIVDFKEFKPTTWGYAVSPEDVALWKSLREKYAGMHHAIVGGEILRAKGYADIAAIVEKHRYLQIAEGFDSWEEKLVYYADKRAKFDVIVPLKERIAEARKRNGYETASKDESHALDEKVFALEKEIYEAAGLTPP